ncbi:MAG: helix-turn-helix transcriptional regulator [Holophagales bacterium]|nr:helix-turn-helix transcriptional regulator [Holophagales bacterium]
MARNYNWKTGCDVEATLSVIGGRWKPVLVCHLLAGRKRFGELRRLTPNATERMITLQLRELEADGVLTRHVYAEVPPRVEYELTGFGRSLEAILELMQAWGKAFKARRLAEEAEQELEAKTA